MPAKTLCKCCNQACENHQMVTCCVCKNRYKHSCVDITSNEVRVLNTNKGYDWTCGGCRTVGKDINDLKSLIIQLQNDIKELKANNARTISQTDFTFEDVVSEISEREKRKNNIILFNVPEADRSKSANEQSASDKNVVVDVLKEIIPEVSLDSIKPIRLGVFTSSKKRPIKVTLDNNDIVRKVLTNARKLQSSNRYKTIILSSDRTKRQIDFYKATKQELIERQNSGETNCRIKFFNGTPRIVNLN
nr:unnamed protein product [Callosobruchus chinensis]